MNRKVVSTNQAMVSASSLQLTVAFTDPDLEPASDPDDAAELEALTQNIYRQAQQLLRDLDEEGTITRVKDTHTLEGSKGGRFLLGLLQAEVSLKNFTALLEFLGDRLGGKPIEIKVKVNGQEKEVEIKAQSRQELLTAEAIVQNLLKSS